MTPQQADLLARVLALLPPAEAAAVRLGGPVTLELVRRFGVVLVNVYLLPGKELVLDHVR